MDDKMSKSVGSSANKDLKTMQTKKRFTSLGSNNNMLVHKDEQSGRMAGTHSYNVLDSEAYIETKRIESRIYAFDKKIREKQIREAERAAKFAQIEAETKQNNSTITPADQKSPAPA